MMRLVVLACVVCAVLASEGSVAGPTPTRAQTGELKESQKFLFGPTNTKCNRHIICKSCIEDMACGWCATSGLCLDGNVLGATVANCSMWEFAWCSGEPCLEHANCDACLSDPLCGWCGATLTCTEGGAQGPMFGDCPTDGWFGESCEGAPAAASLARQSLLQNGRPEALQPEADDEE